MISYTLIIEREANERAQIWRERAVEVEIRDQLRGVLEQLRTSRQERRVAIDAQGLLTTKLQGEKAGTLELRANADHGATAQQQSDHTRLSSDTRDHRQYWTDENRSVIGDREGDTGQRDQRHDYIHKTNAPSCRNSRLPFTTRTIPPIPAPRSECRQIDLSISQCSMPILQKKHS